MSLQMEFLSTNKFHISHVSVLVVTLLINPVIIGATKECYFPAIFNFGDSNSDTGGLAASLIAPTPPYGETYFHRPAGRFSDGRLILDFIAESFGLPYLSAYLDSLGTNFSYGANFATSASTITPPPSILPEGQFSPFYLDYQYFQFKNFKPRTQFSVGVAVVSFNYLLILYGEINLQELQVKQEAHQKEAAYCTTDLLIKEQQSEAALVPVPKELLNNHFSEASNELAEFAEANNGSNLLKRFSVEERSVVSHIFHQWAKKKAFQDPKRLLDKVGFVIDERLRQKGNRNKDLLSTLKSCLCCDEANQYAQYVLRWEQIPADKRAYLMREKQEHFMKLKIENAMGSATPTVKQISYLKKLGCTMTPTSRLHASHLIEQYKSL